MLRWWRRLSYRPERWCFVGFTRCDGHRRLLWEGLNCWRAVPCWITRPNLRKNGPIWPRKKYYSTAIRHRITSLPSPRPNRLNRVTNCFPIYLIPLIRPRATSFSLRSWKRSLSDRNLSRLRWSLPPRRPTKQTFEKRYFKENLKMLNQRRVKWI